MIFNRHYFAACCAVLLLTCSKGVSSAEREQANVKMLEAIKNSKRLKSTPNTPQQAIYTKAGPQIQKIAADPSWMKSSAAERFIKTKNTSNNTTMVQVYVKLEVVDETILNDLERLGLELEITNERFRKVQGWASIESLNRIAELDGVVHITAPNYSTVRRGSRLTEGDAILSANLVRDTGVSGEGVRVGIISDGAEGLRSAQLTGDLPQNVTVLSSCSVAVLGDCSEGTAIAEIIHDIAPDAEIAIAGAGSSMEFIQRLSELEEQFNADIIVDDIGFFVEPYFEDGDVAQAVNELGANVLFVSSAGNGAIDHYQAEFIAETEFNRFHDFGAVANPQNLTGIFTNSVDVDPNETFCTILQWSEPFEQTVSDYDLFIFDSDTNIVGFSASLGPLSLEAACVTNESSSSVSYFVAVERFSGVNREIEMFFLGASEILFTNADDSIFGHPATNRALAVGAIDAQDPGNNTIEFFSSQGPSRIDFPRRENRAKPDVSAIDGVTVTGAAGFPQTFFGTSASAPHVAAIAALLKSAQPNLSGNQLRSAIVNGAVDLGTPGRDNVFGAGRVNALNSLTLANSISTSGSNNASDDEDDILQLLPAIISAGSSR